MKFPRTKSKNKISINILCLVEFREIKDNIDFHEGNINDTSNANMDYKMKIRKTKFHNKFKAIKYKIRVKRGAGITDKTKMKLANM